MRILVVEDEPSAASVLAKGLREHAYAVDVAADGDAALEQISINDYDLILLDVMLPRISGLDVCRRLRAEGAAVPILMLTARGGLEAARRGPRRRRRRLSPQAVPLSRAARAHPRAAAARSGAGLRGPDGRRSCARHARPQRGTRRPPDPADVQGVCPARISGASAGRGRRAAPRSPSTCGTTASIRCRT